mgnify:CR=1 FL=1
MCLAKNIRYLRRKKNLSQDQIAEQLGYKSYTTIQKWETGTSAPQISKLRALSNILGVDINDLVSKDLTKQDDSDKSYHLNEDACEAAEFLHKNPDYKVLFDASRKVKKEDIEFVRQLLDRFSN